MITKEERIEEKIRHRKEIDLKTRRMVPSLPAIMKILGGQAPFILFLT